MFDSLSRVVFALLAGFLYIVYPNYIRCASSNNNKKKNTIKK